ncbi:hypothetical protein [Streptomyces sp. AJS327]|uniref:hypothetical protein n=1 Tax=Streptomyces sp. AJS327 TaxID=2545265 RepID=UPI0021553FB3|nr:hypothetical protein [Streptomyces sp. AJS327]
MSAPTARSPRGIALYTAVLCLLATAAAVFSFVNGSWPLGVVWVLLAGLTSNMAWYYRRRTRALAAAAERDAASAAAEGAACRTVPSTSRAPETTA